MSRLSIKDLERIKNGKVVRYNIFTKEKYSSFVMLDRVQQEINEFNRARYALLKEFKNDITEALEWKKGSKIDSTYTVSFDYDKLFSNGYLALTIPTGGQICLFDQNGLVGASGEITRELAVKCSTIVPYVKRLLSLRDKTNLIGNSFFEDFPVLNSKFEKVLNISGNGIVLPFNDYTELDNIQDLLSYYYSNQEDILKNIVIPNTKELDNYRLDTNEYKVLKLYKGEK